MKLTRFKKYRTWNVISVLGYLFAAITTVFVVIYGISASSINMRADLNEYFYDYITTHIVTPYLVTYKSHLILIVLLIIGSRFEHNHNVEKSEYGLRLFENHEKAYSIAFFTGLALNFLPIYIFTIYIFSTFRRLFG